MTSMLFFLAKREFVGEWWTCMQYELRSFTMGRVCFLLRCTRCIIFIRLIKQSFSPTHELQAPNRHKYQNNKDDPHNIVNKAEQSQQFFRDKIDWNDDIYECVYEYPKQVGPNEKDKELATHCESPNSLQNIRKLYYYSQQGSTVSKSGVVVSYLQLKLLRLSTVLEQLEQRVYLLSAQRTFYPLMQSVIELKDALSTEGVAAGGRNRENFGLFQADGANLVVVLPFPPGPLQLILLLRGCIWLLPPKVSLYYLPFISNERCDGDERY